MRTAVYQTFVNAVNVCGNVMKHCYFKQDLNLENKNSLSQYKFLFIVYCDLVFGTLCIFKKTD
jgi:hypothetical protein